MRSFLSCDQRRPHWGNLCLGFHWIPGLLGDHLLSFLFPFRELLFLRQNLKGAGQYHSSGKPTIFWLSPAVKFLPTERDKSMTKTLLRLPDCRSQVSLYSKYNWHLDILMSWYVKVQYRSLRRCCILHLAAPKSNDTVWSSGRKQRPTNLASLDPDPFIALKC